MKTNILFKTKIQVLTTQLILGMILALSCLVFSACSGGGTATSGSNSNQQALLIVSPNTALSISNQTSYGYLSVTNQSSQTISGIVYTLEQQVGGGSLVTFDPNSVKLCDSIKPGATCGIRYSIPAKSAAGSFAVNVTYPNSSNSIINALNLVTISQKSSLIGVAQTNLQATNSSGINVNFPVEVTAGTSAVIVTGLVSNAAQSFNMVSLVDASGTALPNQKMIGSNLDGGKFIPGDTFAIVFELPQGLTSQDFYLQTSTLGADNAIQSSKIFAEKYTVAISNNKAIVNLLPPQIGLSPTQNSQLVTIANMGDTTATLTSLTSDSTSITISPLSTTKLEPGANTVVQISLNNSSINMADNNDAVTLTYNDGTTNTTQNIIVIPSTINIQYKAFTSVTPNNAGNGYASCSVSESGVLHCQDGTNASLNNPYGLTIYGEHLYLLSTASSSYLYCDVDLNGAQVSRCIESSLVDSSGNDLLSGGINSISISEGVAYIVSNGTNDIVVCNVGLDWSLEYCGVTNPGDIDFQPVIQNPSGVAVYEGATLFYINYNANINSSAPILTECILTVDDGPQACSPINFTTSANHPIAVTTYKGYVYIINLAQQEESGVDLNTYSICKITEDMDTSPECSTNTINTGYYNANQSGIAFHDGFAYITNNDPNIVPNTNNAYNVYYTQCAVESPSGLLTNCAFVDGTLDLPGAITFTESASSNTYYIHSLNDYLNHLTYQPYTNTTAQSISVGASGSQVSLYTQESWEITSLQYNFYSSNTCESNSLIVQKNYYPELPATYINLSPGVYTTTDEVNYGVCSNDGFIVPASHTHCTNEFNRVKSMMINYSFASPGAGLIESSGCMTNPANPIISGGGEAIANYESNSACTGPSNCHYSQAYYTSYYSLCNYTNESTYHNCQIFTTNSSYNGNLSQYNTTQGCNFGSLSESGCGYTGGNAVCQIDSANPESVNATWHALLYYANSTVPAVRYYQPGGSFIQRADGPNFVGCTGTLSLAIGGSTVWTGAAACVGGADADSGTCAGFTSGSSDGDYHAIIGQGGQATTEWINNGSLECGKLGRLYCVEQVLPPATQ